MRYEIDASSPEAQHIHERPDDMIHSTSRFVFNSLDVVHRFCRVVDRKHLTRASKRGVIALLAMSAEAPASFTKIERHARRTSTQLICKARIVPFDQLRNARRIPTHLQSD